VQLSVGYLNATRSRGTQNAERVIGPDVSGQTHQNPQVDGYVARFGPPRSSRSGFRTFWNPTEPFFRYNPGPLAGYLDPLLTLSGTLGNTTRVSSKLGPQCQCPFLILLFQPCPSRLPGFESQSRRILQWGFLLPGWPLCIIRWSRRGPMFAVLS